MHVGPRITDFLICSQEVRTEADLQDLVSEATRRLGFQKFALVSHVDLIEESGEAVAISDYDDAWVDRILSRRYYLDDPLHAASTHTVLSFAWHNALMVRTY